MHLRLGTLWLLLVVSFGGTAIASPAAVRAPKVRDGLAGDARAAFDRASELFENDNFGAARAEFERAYELSRDPRLLYNVAVCEKSLHHYARALTALEKSLATEPDTLPLSYKNRVNDTVRTLTPYVSTLEVRVSEPGARVYVDDELAGTSPLSSAVRVDVGDHVVIAKKAGFLEEPRKVRVDSGAPAELVLVLEPTLKRAVVEVDAPGVRGGRVLVDGVDVGAAPFAGVLEVGRHAVTVRAAGFRAETRLVDVAVGAPQKLSFELSRETHEARLRVTTSSDRDVVSLDGRVIGKGGFFGAVPSGEHVLRVSRDDARSQTRDLVLREDETRSIEVTLDERSTGVPTWLWVTGGVALVGAAAATGIVLASRSPTYEGSNPGTLDPRVVLATYGGAR